MVKQLRVGIETHRQTLHLSPLTAETRAAIHIVIHRLRGRQHIHHLHQRVDAAGQTGTDDGVGMVFLHKTHGAHRRIDLADAALPQHNLVVAQTACIASDGIMHLAILNIHSNNDSYFHILFVIILLCKSTLFFAI